MVGKITSFSKVKNEDTESSGVSKSIPKIPNNAYVLLRGRGCYALTKSRKTDSTYLVKVPKLGQSEQVADSDNLSKTALYEEVEVDFSKQSEGFSREISF